MSYIGSRMHEIILDEIEKISGENISEKHLLKETIEALLSIEEDKYIRSKSNIQKEINDLFSKKAILLVKQGENSEN